MSYDDFRHVPVGRTTTIVFINKKKIRLKKLRKQFQCNMPILTVAPGVVSKRFKKHMYRFGLGIISAKLQK